MRPFLKARPPSEAGDSYSLNATDKDSDTLGDSGSVTVGPSGVSGTDTQTIAATGSDSFGGHDSAVVTAAGGARDDRTT